MSNNIDDVIKEKMNDEANKILQENAAAIEEHGAQLAMDLTADGITKDDLFMGQLVDAVTMFEDGTIEGKLNEAAAEMLRTTGSETLSVTDVMQIIDKAIREAMKDIAPATKMAIEVTSEIVKGIWAENAAAIMELAQQEDRLKTIEPLLEEELQKAAQEDETLKQYTAHGVMHDYLLLKGGAAEKTPPALKPVIDRAFTRWIILEQEQNGEKLPTIKNLVPARVVMPNNMLTKYIYGELGKKPINAGAFDLPAINAKGKKPAISTWTMINYEADPAAAPFAFEGYEQEVMNGLCSIWEAATNAGELPTFTIKTLNAAISGGDKPSKKAAADIIDTIERHRHTFAEVDVTEEYRERGLIGEDETFMLRDYLLSIREGERSKKSAKGGKPITKYYVMTAEPLPLTYARATKQLVTVSAELMAPKRILKNGQISEAEKLPMTWERIAMTGHMIRRIKVMKRDREEAQQAMRNYEAKRKRQPELNLEAKPLSAFEKQSHTMLFDDIFNAAGLNEQDRDRAKKNRDFCCDVLNYWKAKGEIKGYSIKKKGRNIAGVIVYFSEQEAQEAITKSGK